MEVGGALRGGGSESDGGAQDPGVRGRGWKAEGEGAGRPEGRFGIRWGGGPRGRSLTRRGAPSGRSCNRVSGNAATSAAAASAAALNLEQPPLGVLEISRKALLGLRCFCRLSPTELDPPREGLGRRGTALSLAGICGRVGLSPHLPGPRALSRVNPLGPDRVILASRAPEGLGVGRAPAPIPVFDRSESPLGHRGSPG